MRCCATASSFRHVPILRRKWQWPTIGTWCTWRAGGWRRGGGDRRGDRRVARGAASRPAARASGRMRMRRRSLRSRASSRRMAPSPAIQIAHAGRKASAEVPWKGGKALTPDEPARLADDRPIGQRVRRAACHIPPRAMTLEDIARVKGEFVAARQARPRRWVRVAGAHFAHGYLGQSFFSPLANKRTDQYGGSFEGRSRFLIETLEAVRAYGRRGCR